MTIHNLKERGFTLIELLVVIAIIGILASVVLASLNTARDKGSDASAKASLTNARAQAEIYYDDNDRDYTDVCTTAGASNGIADLVSAAEDATGNTATCVDDTSDWGVEIQLTANDGAEYYCVDSTGNAVVATTSTSLADTDGNRDCD